MPNEMANIQAQQQQQWEPSYTQEQLSLLIKKYDQVPSTFKQEEIDTIKQHAEYYGMSFYDGDFSVLEAVKQAGAGFVEGFTTMSIADHPDNEYEAVARNIGHLAGFAPGILSKPLALMGAKGLASKAGALRSIPMAGADFVTKKAKKLISTSSKAATVGRQGAVGTVSNFLLGNKMKHIAEGAFHLGVASGISSWQGGVDEMVQGFIGGAKAGGVFRLIGNYVKVENPTGKKLARGLAGSLFMGLPSTMRGATTPEQVYEYVMGAYFGSNEMSWSTHKAQKSIQKMEKEAQGDPKIRAHYDPERLDWFHELPEEVKPKFKELADKRYGVERVRSAIQEALLQGIDQADRISDEITTKEGFKLSRVVVDGEEQLELDASTIAQDKSYMSSGGAKGADTILAKLAHRYGIPTVNRTFPEHYKEIYGPGVPHILTKSQLKQADPHLYKANETLQRPLDAFMAKQNPYIANLWRRSYYQVKDAHTVYSFGKLVKNNEAVDGGTGWATQMALDLGKRVYVYDVNSSQWNKWNNNLGRFVGMKNRKPPKPPRHFAGIGTRTMGEYPNAIKAADDFFGTHFKPQKTIEESALTPETLEKPIKESNKVELSPEEKKQVKLYETELDEIENEIVDLSTELKENWDLEINEPIDLDLDIQLRQELDILGLKSQDKQKAHFELVNRGIDLENTSKAIAEGDKVIEDIEAAEDLDFETPVENVRAGKRSMAFIEHGQVKPLMSKLWNTPDLAHKKQLKLETANKVARHISKWIDKDTKINRVEDVIKGIEEELTVSFSEAPEAKGALRQWLTMRNWGEIVPQFQANERGIGKLSGVSLGGNKQYVEEPPKRLDAVYKAAGGQGPSYAILDKITVEENGRLKDYDLSTYRENVLLRENFWDQGKADKAYNAWLGELMEQNGSDKGGRWFPMGGKGDNDRIYWAKVHPSLQKADKGEVVKITAKMLQIAEGASPGFKANYFEMEKKFADKYAGETSAERERFKQLHREAFLSNLKYDIEVNGLEFTNDNIKKVLGSQEFTQEALDITNKSELKLIDKTTKVVELEHSIKSVESDRIVSARTDMKNNRIILNQKEIEKTFNEKAWTKPKVKGVKPLPENTFKTVEEWKNFVIAHEKAHFTTANKALSKGVERENHANELALNILKDKASITPDFINSSKAWNKRAQIWLSNSWPGDARYISDRIADLHYKDGKDLFNTGQYKYIISPDLDPDIKAEYNKNPRYGWETSRKNSELGENVDGAIIIRDDLIDIINLDFGQPESGANKSFIVSPHAEHGALLGKYMFHAAGPEMTKMMKNRALHMIMQESAVKQRGTRGMTEYAVNKGELNYDMSKQYYLDPAHVLGNFSVKMSHHMLENQRLPKQMFMSLMPSENIGEGLIKDMFEGIIGEKWNGKASLNKMGEMVYKSNDFLDSYFAKIDTGAKQSELRLMEDKIVKNLENLGIENLMSILENNYSESLSEKVYKEILRIDRNTLAEAYAEKNISKLEYLEALSDINEYETVTQRQIGESMIWAEQERAAGREATMLGTYMHKNIRDYRMTALKNYVVNIAAKPKMGNSIAAVMRPYDKAMRINLDGNNRRLLELETNDEIFFLDDAFKNRVIDADISGLGKIKTLGTLWEKYEAGEFHGKIKEEVEEYFRAATVRVPMDSKSGTQVLRFAGFTGRKGHGILLHGRAMRAEGGADLDGDKSFVFFGGKNGLTSEWKDAYYNAKKEFYFTENGIEMVGDNKEAVAGEGAHKGKAFNQFLALQMSDDLKSLHASKAAMYSPLERIRISEAAVGGRNQLGPAVSSKQVMASAYAGILASEKGQDELIISHTDKKKGFTTDYIVPIKLRTSKEWQQYQKELTRAMLGLASDPMDEMGLSGKDVWFKKMWDAHFEIDHANIKRKTKKGKEYKLNQYEKDHLFNPKKKKDYLIKMSDLKSGKTMFGKYNNINKAYWGKNWSAGRQFNVYEMAELGSSYFDIQQDTKRINTFLPLIGEKLANIQLTDSIYNRVNSKEVERLYSSNAKNLKQYDWLKDLLGRSSFNVPHNQIIKIMSAQELYNPSKLRRLIDRPEKWEEIFEGTHLKNDWRWEKAVNDVETEESYNARKLLTREFAILAEDALSKDLTDMSTIALIGEITKKMKTEGDLGVHSKAATLEENIAFLADAANKFKQNSWLAKKDRNKIYAFLTSDLARTPQGRKIANFLEEEAKNVPLQPHLWKKEEAEFIKKALSPEDSRSLTLDNIEMDIEVKAFKEGLTPLGAKLFDHLMLGSLRKHNVQKIDAFINQFEGNIPEDLADVISSLRKGMAGTNTSKLGFMLQSVNNINIREHLGQFNKLVNKVWKRPDVELIKANQELNTNETMGSKEAIEAGMPDRAVEETIYKIVDTGFEGIKAGKLDAESRSIVSELAATLKGYGDNVTYRINELTRGILGKDFNVMNKQDFIALNNFFNDIKNGSIWQQMFEKNGLQKLRKRHYWLFPRAVNTELMRDDIQLLRRRGFFVNKLGTMVEGQIATPTGYIETLQHFISIANDSAVEEGDAMIKVIKENLFFLNSIKEGEAIRKMAVAVREMGNIKRFNDSDQQHKARTYIESLKKVEKEVNWKTLKNKIFNVEIDGKRVEKTGIELMHKSNEQYTNFFKDMYGFIEGKEGALDKYIIKGRFHDKKRQNPIYDVNKFVADVSRAVHNGTANRVYWKKFGIDGLRRIARSAMFERIHDPEILKRILAEPEIKTGKIEFEHYWPHMFFDSKEAKRASDVAIKRIMSDPKLTEEVKNEELKKLMYRHRAMDGEWNFEDLDDWHMADKIILEIAEKKEVSEENIKWFNSNERSGNMQARTSTISGWTLDSSAAEAYARQMSNTFFRQLSQIFGREIIEGKPKAMSIDGITSMRSAMFKKYGADQTNAWTEYAKLYVQDALGNPSVVPQRLIDNPNMALKGTPYAAWADNKVKDRVNKMLKAVGITDKKLPEALQGVDLQTIRNLSNMEAKYEMASLLAHPKSMVGNIFGGTAHTVQSAGWRNFLHARNIKELRKINSEWKTIEDVENFVVSHGVLPDFLVYEFGLHEEYQKVQNKEFIEAVSQKISRNPNAGEESIKELAKKYKITDKVNEFAAKFMSVPEKALRRDAFMAHYLQAWNKFGGALKDPNHPFLIEMGKKGVKATQFLYSAPFRPAFARTALGKIMTRFQLWSWNAVRFRNDVAREAKIYGFLPGTEQYEKFQRTAQIDMFVFALANVFAYSLFEATLPAPWSYLQDTADWVFGDEKERDKAFFGSYPTAVAPLQLVTPPILRLLPPMMRAIVDDDWSRVSEYYAYTMFPFGRIARDVAGPGNVLENPMRIMEKTTGFPLQQMSKGSKNIREGKYNDKIYPGSYE